MLEKDIEREVKAYARSKNFLAYKFVSPGHAFVPDALLISPTGKTCFIEFKRKGGKATSGQLREHARIRANNMSVFLIDDVGVGKLLIDAMLGVTS